MTAALRLAPDRTVALLAVAGFLGAAAVGLLPWWVAALGAAATLGVVFAVAAVLRPRLALAALVVVEISNVSEVLGFGELSPFLLALGLGLVATALGIARGTVRLRYTPLALAAVVYLAGQLLSWTVSEDAAAAQAVVVRTAKDLVFLAVVVVVMSSGERQVGTAKLVVLAFVALAALTIGNQFLLGNATSLGGFSNVPKGVDLGGVTSRHAGPLRDANFWGRVLVLVVPLAVSLAAIAALRPAAWMARARRWGWSAAAVVLVVGIYLTQSRGAILSLVIGLLVWFAVAGPRYRRLLLAAPVVFLVLLLLPGLGSRLATLAQIDQAQEAGGDSSLVQRVAVQEVSLAMFAANPATGVGIGNFEGALQEYRHESEVMPRRVIAPHNLYLQLAAEGGAVGLLGWVILYGTAVVLAARALMVSARLPQANLEEVRLLAAGVLGGLTAWAFASTFLHLAHIRSLLVVMALAAALDLSARRAAAAGSVHAAAPPVPGIPWSNLTATAAGFAAGVAVVVVGPLAASVITPRWAVEHHVSLEPRQAPQFSDDAYALDLLSRRSTVQTYAAIVDSPRFRAAAEATLALDTGTREDLALDVTGSHDSALVTVTATGSDPAAARELSRVVLEEARAYVNSLNAHYTMTGINPAGTGPVRVRQLGLVDSLLLLLAALATGVVVRARVLRLLHRRAARSGGGRR